MRVEQLESSRLVRDGGFCVSVWSPVHYYCQPLPVLPPWRHPQPLRQAQFSWMAWPCSPPPQGTSPSETLSSLILRPFLYVSHQTEKAFHCQVHVSSLLSYTLTHHVLPLLHFTLQVFANICDFPRCHSSSLLGLLPSSGLTACLLISAPCVFCAIKAAQLICTGDRRIRSHHLHNKHLSEHWWNKLLKTK